QQAPGLPCLHVLQLLRKLGGISGGRKRLTSENRRRLVMPVSIARSPSETQNNDVRTESPDVPHDISQHAIARPLGQRFRGGFRESEIDSAREELLAAVDLPRRQ